MAGRGGIRLYITAESKGLNRGLNQAQSSVDRFAKGAGRLSRLGGGGLAGVVGGLTSLGGAAALLKDSTTATMDLYKATRRLSTVTGMDMQSSNAWINVAQSRGIKTDQLVRSYTTLAKQIGLAQRGGKTAVATFQQLGVSQETLRTGNTAQIMAKVSDGFTRYADGLGKSRVASQLFGRSYAPMLGLLNKGSGTLRGLLRDELKHGGQLTLTTEAVRARKARSDPVQHEHGEAEGHDRQRGTAVRHEAREQDVRLAAARSEPPEDRAGRSLVRSHGNPSRKRA